MQEVLRLNPWLSIGFISWMVAQVMKMIVDFVATRKLDFSRLVDSGGMPSSHTALVTGLSTAVGITEGWQSCSFAISTCFAMIIIYDATNLRRSAGYHAQVLNDVVPQLLRGKLLGEGFAFPKLRELLGHNPFEVFVGGILGILIALWVSNYLQLAVVH
jgi:uncharacterized protein